MKYTFKKDQRYMTKGIHHELPFNIQVFLWQCVDKLVKKPIETDYLQIFTFSLTKEGDFEIKHHQEQPDYSAVHKKRMEPEYIPLLNKKIYVIDDLSHSTMLFADEY